MEAVHVSVLGEGWGEKVLKRALQHCLRVSRLGNTGYWCVRSWSAATKEGKFGGSLLKVVSGSKKPNLLSNGD